MSTRTRCSSTSRDFGPAFLGDRPECVRAVVRDGLGRWCPLRRIPQRVFETVRDAEHGIGRHQPVVYRYGPQGSALRQLLVREADAEAAGIVLADLRVGVGRRRPATET